jgi:LUD domain
MTEVQPDLDTTLSRRFAARAEDARVRRTAAALEANGISVLRASNGAEAKRIVLDLIPAGAQVHHGASQTLEVSGIADEIEGSGRVGTSPCGHSSSAWTARRRPTRSVACPPRQM